MSQKERLFSELAKKRSRVDIMVDGEMYSHISDSKNQNYLNRLKLKIKKILPEVKFYEVKPQVRFGKKVQKPIFLYANYQSFMEIQLEKPYVDSIRFYNENIGITGKGYRTI